MKPRSYLGLWITATALSLVPLTGSMTGLFYLIDPSSLRLALLTGLATGAAASVIIGLLVAARFRLAVKTLELGHLRSVRNLVVSKAAELGYRPGSDLGDWFTLRPSLHTGLLAGDILVRLGERTLELIGPEIYVSRLAEQLIRASEAAEIGDVSVESSPGVMGREESASR